MKKNSFILIVIFFASLLTACEKNYDDTISALVILDHNIYNDSEDLQQTKEVAYIQVEAIMMGTPNQSFEYIQVGNKKLNNAENFYSFNGLIEYFDEVKVEEDLNLDPLEVIIKTSIGEIQGSISIPDTIKSFTVDAADNISTGTPVTVSWSGSNADYYEVRYIYEYMVDEQNFNEIFADTIVASLSVTLEGSRFAKDGRIFSFKVRPINGPIPVEGTKHNMKGDGFGYLIFENDIKRSDKLITVGKGISEPFVGAISSKSVKIEDDTEYILKMAEKLGIK